MSASAVPATRAVPPTVWVPMVPHRPLKQAVATVDGWSATVWSEPVAPGEQSLDSWFVSIPSPHVRRVGVFDAAAPPGADVAALVRLGAELCDVFADGDLDAAVGEASSLLCDPAVRPRQANPLFAAAVCDVEPSSGRLRAVCAADAEVWVCRGGVWSSVFAGDMLRDDARAAWVSAVGAGSSSEQRWAAQFDVLDNPACWRRPPLGMVASPQVASVVLDGVEAVIVSSDGARLSPSRCARLEWWLGDGIHDVDDSWPHRSPHGDVTVVRVAPLDVPS